MNQAAGIETDSNDGRRDFDFLAGRWQVKHERRASWLKNDENWFSFDGETTVWPILGGRANVDDNLIHAPKGTYRASTLRSFDPSDRKWSIWWLDERWPQTVGVPVRGGFEGGIGTFFCDDSWEEQPIKIRFIWTVGAAAPRWEQSFSADGGDSWEKNWVMTFNRAG